MPTITELSRSFDVTRNTVRRWSSDFSDFLSSGANPPAGETREFTEDDAAALALVARLRAKHKDTEEIAAALAAGDRAEWPPEGAEWPPESETAEETTTAIVPRLMSTIARYEGELDAVKEERDYLRSKMLDAEKRAASAETRANMLQQQIEKMSTNVNTPPPPAASVDQDQQTAVAGTPPAAAPAPGAVARFWQWLTGQDRPQE